MRATRFLLLLAIAAGLNSCSFLGMKSVPFGSVAINDSDAMTFMRGAPRAKQLAQTLPVRRVDADGRLVALVVSGGGMRAAAFTFGVLDGLQSLEDYDALRDVDLISSNSGGGWAAARYLMGAAKDRGFKLAAAQPEIVKEFVAASKGRVPCWYRRIHDKVLPDITLGQLYNSGEVDPLPAIYFNSSLMPAQAPFVFTQEYLDYYQVSSFRTCQSEAPIAGSKLEDLPLALAATLSSTVPAFYWGFADTRLCDPPQRAGSLCFANQKDGARRFLALFDGGLYDNIGYKTAYEVIDEGGLARHSDNDLTIVINSNTDTLDHTVGVRDTRNKWVLTIATSAMFPNQNATFQRLYEPLFRNALVNRLVLLDYQATANFPEDMATQERLLAGLEILADYAANQVKCFDGQDRLQGPVGKASLAPPPVAVSLAKLRSRGRDCLLNNFARAGTLGKTTYQADPLLFRVQWQLGILAVRMQSSQLGRQAPAETLSDNRLLDQRAGH